MTSDTIRWLWYYKMNAGTIQWPKQYMMNRGHYPVTLAQNEGHGRNAVTVVQCNAQKRYKANREVQGWLRGKPGM